MPAATTHYEFSKEVFLSLNNQYSDKITNLHMFYLGSQGPDIFFFHKAGMSKKSLNSYGNIMHHAKVRQTLAYLLEHSRNDSDLLSYTYGFACHYALDSLEHPLVFYMAKHGLSKEKDEGENVNHIRIEAFYDKELLASKGLGIDTFNVNVALEITKTDSIKLASLYKQLFKDVYDVDVPFISLEESTRDISRFLTLLKPDETKYKAVNTIENLLKRKHTISALMLNTDMDPVVLNKEHKEFFNIFAEQYKSNESFFDLYDKAILKAKNLIESDFNEKYIDLTFDGRIIDD